jgi:hypothetical protein
MATRVTRLKAGLLKNQDGLGQKVIVNRVGAPGARSSA